MKNLTMRTMIAVAALAAAAATASAQTYKADIPMAFRAGGKSMAPGAYELLVVTTPNGHPMLTVRNLATHSAAILLASPGADAPKAWRQEGNPRIAFQCVSDKCSLSGLWNGLDLPTYAFPSPKLPAADLERLSSITVALSRAD